MNFAEFGGGMPKCAGGDPPPVPLMVAYATADSDSKVTVTFTESVDPATAQVAANYSFRPAATVTAATVVAGEPAKVAVTAQLKPETQYMIIASNVTATDDAHLDPTNRYAQFKTPT